MMTWASFEYRKKRPPPPDAAAVGFHHGDRRPGRGSPGGSSSAKAGPLVAPKTTIDDATATATACSIFDRAVPLLLLPSSCTLILVDKPCVVCAVAVGICGINACVSQGKATNRVSMKAFIEECESILILDQLCRENLSLSCCCASCQLLLLRCNKQSSKYLEACLLKTVFFSVSSSFLTKK